MRIFSGIQPTGRKHVGNYIGAIRGWVEGQDRGNPTIHCIVDLHATGVAYDPAALPGYVLDTTAMLIAAGLDPSRCILFRQSDVMEHSELCWLLSASTAYGDLQRMHQFKDKSAREQQLVRTSLFLYPVLQAADVLAYIDRPGTSNRPTEAINEATAGKRTLVHATLKNLELLAEEKTVAQRYGSQGPRRPPGLLPWFFLTIFVLMAQKRESAIAELREEMSLQVA